MTALPVATQAPFTHHGSTGAMVRLSLVNLLLNVVTLSLWRFWGKTRVRRMLWGGTSAWGDPAEYTGRGGELFLGFIVVMVAIFTPIVVAMGAAQAAVAAGHTWAGLIVFVLQVAIIVLAGAGLYRARRYQLTRTIWRGIRGGQRGEAWRYGVMMIAVGVTTSVTLGWAWPWAEMTLTRYRMENTTFGDTSFECDARAKPLYKRFAVLWLAGLVFLAGIAAAFGAGVYYFKDLEEGSAEFIGFIAALYAGGAIWALLTIGVPLAWYRAGFLRHLAAHTRFAGISFAIEATTGSLIRLTLGNILISILSLGILRPWTAQRVFRYACAHLRVSGEPDWQTVCQAPESRSRMGEGMAAVFDGAGEF